jgi:hypothetical protein
MMVEFYESAAEMRDALRPSSWNAVGSISPIQSVVLSVWWEDFANCAVSRGLSFMETDEVWTCRSVAYCSLVDDDVSIMWNLTSRAALHLPTMYPLFVRESSFRIPSLVTTPRTLLACPVNAPAGSCLSSNVFLFAHRLHIAAAGNLRTIP